MRQFNSGDIVHSKAGTRYRVTRDDGDTFRGQGAEGYIDDVPKSQIAPGSIIGKTRSGKEIYDQVDHPAHKGFTAEDHEDANLELKGGAGKHISDSDRTALRVGHLTAAGKMRLDQQVQKRESSMVRLAKAKASKEEPEKSVQVGPRGGKHYITKSGKKVYVGSKG